MEGRLQNRIRELARLQRAAGLFSGLAKCWFAGLVVALALVLASVWLGRQWPRPVWVAPLAITAGLIAVCITRHQRRPDDLAAIVSALEPDQPEIRHLLAAAAEQNSVNAAGVFGFMQLRVIEEALAHPAQARWRLAAERRLRLAKLANVASLFLLAALLFALQRGGARGVPGLAALVGDEITVAPGDTQVERGTGLVITARFGGVPPAEVTLVVHSGAGKEVRLPMARRLADPIFGATLPEVTEPGVYRIEYRSRQTREFHITIFEFPALVRADADLRYPEYTGLTNRTIRDTLRVSAVQGTHLVYTLQLNKSVVRARLVAKDQAVTLATPSNAVALLPDYVFSTNAHYALELADAEGRANKFPTDFFFQALTNQRPEVKLLFPHGDRRVSRIEELQVEAEAVDDFGLIKYGIGFGVAGQDPQFVESGQAAPARVRKRFSHLISLEQFALEPDQAIVYFAWADDYGPDGSSRRTFSDMFFADVRPFEEVFREDQSGAAESGGQNGGQNGGQGSGGGNDRTRLAELQKQIVIATWNLQRERGSAPGAKRP